MNTRRPNAMLRIGLIDDSPADSEITREALLTGIPGQVSITTAGTLVEGWELCTGSDAPDIVLLDVHLPGGDGLELLERLGQGRRLLPLPVIMLTGSSGDEVASRALALGATDFVEKEQISPRLLRRVIYNAMERFRLRRQLLEANEHHASLIQAIPQIVWTARHDGTMDYLSPQWDEYVGTDPKDPDRLDWNHYVHPDDLAKTQEAWRAAVAAGTTYEAHQRLRSASGEYRWFKTRGVPVRCECNGRIKWFGTGTDIHNEKLAQAELADASERKDAFLAMLSHELRNPLAAISAGVTVLQKAAISEDERQEAHGILLRQAAQLNRLVNDLLDLSRMKTGKLQLCTRRLDLVAVVRSVVADHAHLAQSKNIDLRLNLPREAVWVEGDADRLGQCVGNLLHNASKFTPEGGSIDVEVGTDAEACAATVTVTDSGEGIAMEELGSLFEPFYQGRRKGGSLRSDGMGIGLSLIQHLVRLHGGRIAAESAGVGHGSTFRIMLGLCPAPAEVARETSAGDDETGGLRVLLVEDSESNSRMLEILFSSEGHDVRIASTGEQAMEIAREFNPHVVFCDLRLPGTLQGTDLPGRLRAEPAFAQTRFAALTGAIRPEDVERCRQAGFDDFVAKPPTPEILRAVLGKAAPAVSPA